MLLLSVLCLIGTALALPVPQLAEAQASDESDNLFDDILKAVQVATPIVTALAGKREIQVSDDLFADILAVVSQGPDPCGFAGCAYLLQQELLAKAQAGDEADNLFDDILKAVQVATPIVTALAGKRELSEEQENLFGDILKVVETVAPLAVAVLGKREVSDDLYSDILIATQPVNCGFLGCAYLAFQDTLAAAESGDEADNLFDDILKAVQVATPIVTALAGKREVADSEWFDTFLAAVEAATPTILGVIQGAGTA